MKLSLKNVRALLFNIHHKWYDIGIELEIDVRELDIIRERFSDPRDCLLEMIKTWLKYADPWPTWKILADVLRGDIFNEVALAQQGIN